MPKPDPSGKLIRLDNLVPALRRPALSGVTPLLESLLAVGKINRIHSATEIEDCHGAAYFQSCLHHLGVTVDVTGDDLSRIPESGPVVVVANHPFGGIDALALASILIGRRPDARILANFLVGAIPKVKPWIIPVDPFGAPGAARKNARSVREAIDHLHSGGILGVFPGGTVSHFHLSKGKITDPSWSHHIAAIIQKSGASVVPAYFSGRNSISFQVLGMLHPLVRTAMLPRETVKKKGRTLRLRIGNPIPPSRLKDYATTGQLARFLRLCTYILKARTPVPTRVKPQHRSPAPAPLAPPVPHHLLAEEIASLPTDALLYSQATFDVLLASASQIPVALQEIGRLRESSFRAVGEGTGNPLDLDHFDPHYSHLFLWDKEARKIAGAYRFCRADELLKTRGQSALYSATLFKFRPGFLADLGPALELGRSFITPEYQLKHNALSLLWKGIGRFILRHPEYHLLFGPVSISQDYRKLSRNLLVEFIKNTRSHPVLSGLVRPSKPHRGHNLMGLSRSDVAESIRSIEDVSMLISEIEADGKGVPVLLKHYIRLNALLLSFNVDKNFSNCLDGLMLVDLTRSDPRILSRYLTPEGVAKVRHLASAPSSGTSSPALTAADPQALPPGVPTP